MKVTFKSLIFYTFRLTVFVCLASCVFKPEIIVTIPKKLSLVNSNVTNTAPSLDAIANQTVVSGNALSTVDAGDSGLDVDADGDVLTYSCFYDSVVDSAVASTSACSTLSGVTFSSSSGVMNWTPNYSQAGAYEFKIIATDGNLSDDKIFSITVNNMNQAPVLDAISNQTVNENVAITAINAGDGGDDLDADGDTISYTCYFDTTVDGAVATTSACSTLTGVSFTTATGVMNWTPSYSQSGVYEFKITGSDGSLSDSRIFTITVNNTNQAPVLDAIANQAVNENVAITTVNAGDGGDDLDGDGNAITYTCYFDTTVDGAVATTSACSSLTGVTFTAATGVMNWTPSYSQSGVYEFKIIGSDGSLTDSKIFTITVNNVNRAPALDAIADQSINAPGSFTAINAADGGDDFDVDGDAITYSCYYDTTIDGAVAATTACTNLSGVTFASSTGVLNWTATLAQAGAYEFKISGTDGSLSGSRIFKMNVDNLTPFISQLTTTVASTAIDLPIASGGTYNFTVDWGDGSSIATITSYNDAAKNHTYAAAGTYTVTMTGVATLLSYSSALAASKTSLTKILDLGNMGYTSFYAAFDGCSNLTEISGGKTSQVTTMARMFRSTKLATADFSTWDTSKVTAMDNMFDSTKFVTLNLSSFNTANVTSMSSMFYNITPLTSLDITSFDTAKVTIMSSMFASLSNLTALDLSRFNTGNVTNMFNMFSATTKLTTLDLSEFNTSKVTNMGSMFSGAGVVTLDVSSFDTQLVTSMANMFAGATKLANLNLSNFVTTNVTNMTQVFYNMPELLTLNISNFDTTKVTNMTEMFRASPKITSLDLSNFRTPALINVSGMFWSTTLLTSLNTTNWDISHVTNSAGIFSSTNASLAVTCNYGTFFGKTCQ